MMLQYMATIKGPAIPYIVWIHLLAAAFFDGKIHNLCEASLTMALTARMPWIR